MRFSLLTATALCGVSLVGAYAMPSEWVSPYISGTAQAEVIAQSNPLAENFGTVDPNEMVEIEVINKTSFDLFAAISGGARVEMEPLEATTFQFDATPVSLFVYPTPTTPGSTLQFETVIEDNIITIQVLEIDDVAPGYRTITIEPSGNVYMF